MNRILFEAAEMAGELIHLRDVRATHLRTVLRVMPGDPVRCGVIDGLPFTAEVVTVDDQGVSLRVLAFGDSSCRPPVDLLLALPRPKVLHRLLPQIAALGVGTLYLTNAARVERSYFDSHVLEPSNLRASLVEGLTQCGDTGLPKVRMIRRLRPFLDDELPGLLAGRTGWVLHPGEGTPLLRAPLRGPDVFLAVGPEGGWIPFEVEMFRRAGLCPVTLGGRVLRSDTAVVAALALAAARCQNFPSVI